MKYKKSFIAGVALISLATSGIVVAATHQTPQIPTSTHQTSITEQPVAAVTPQEVSAVEPTPVATVTPVAEVATPAPTPAPQTSVDWWRALKVQSEDETSCFLGIILKLGKPASADPATLQTQYEYATNTYGSACFALAHLGNMQHVANVDAY